MPVLPAPDDPTTRSAPRATSGEPTCRSQAPVYPASEMVVAGVDRVVGHYEPMCSQSTEVSIAYISARNCSSVLTPHDADDAGHPAPVARSRGAAIRPPHPT